MGGMEDYSGLVRWATPVPQEAIWGDELKNVAMSYLENINRIRCLALTPAVIAAHAEAKGRDEEIEQEHLMQGAAAVEHYHWNIPAVGSGMQSLFSAVIIGAWTAFESLATDLWIEAVNLRPKSLGLRALRTCRRQRAAPELDATQQKAAKPRIPTVTVEMLDKYDFDLKGRIGYVLWYEREFDFNTLKAIQQSYKLVFGKDCESWFVDDLYQKQLPLLEAHRHVFVHRGGKVDQFFIDRVEHIPSLALLSKGTPIHIESDVAKGYVQLATDCSTLLLNKVDVWLQTNK